MSYHDIARHEAGHAVLAALLDRDGDTFPTHAEIYENGDGVCRIGETNDGRTSHGSRACAAHPVGAQLAASAASARRDDAVTAGARRMTRARA